MSANPKMTAKMNQPPPMYFQDMVEYTLARVDVSGTPLQAVKERLAPRVEDGVWAERYYGPALHDEVPEDLRPGLETKLWELVEPMTEQDRQVVETWNAAERAFPHA